MARHSVGSVQTWDEHLNHSGAAPSGGGGEPQRTQEVRSLGYGPNESPFGETGEWNENPIDTSGFGKQTPDAASPPVPGSPSGTGNPKYDAPYSDASPKQAAGESAQETFTTPGSEHPFIGASEAGRAVMGKPVTAIGNESPDIPGYHPHGVLAPGPNLKVNRFTDVYVDRATGGPDRTNADALDKELAGYQSMKDGQTRRIPTGETLTKDALIEGFRANHPKRDLAAIADDEGGDHGFVPLNPGQSDDAVLQDFYKAHGQKKAQ